jgi:hypothetical protein
MRPPTEDIGWVAYLAAGIELVLAAKTLEEAREVARERIRDLVHPSTGVRQIPDELRKRWYVAANRRVPRE